MREFPFLSCAVGLPRPWARRLGLALSCVALAGALSACASRVQVRGIGSGAAPPFYELRGHSLAALQEQAKVVCPTGFQVARSWQRTRPADGGAGMLSTHVAWVEDTVLPHAGDQAQMTIQCSTGQPRFEPIGAPPKPSGVAVGPLSVVSEGEMPVVRPGQAAAPPPAPVAPVAPPAKGLDGSAPGVAPKPAAPTRPADRKASGAAAKSPFSVPSSGEAGRGAM